LLGTKGYVVVVVVVVVVVCVSVKQDLVCHFYNPASRCAVKQKYLSYSFRGRVEMHIMEHIGANLKDKIN
jgi:hypothetical protein